MRLSEITGIAGASPTMTKTFQIPAVIPGYIQTVATIICTYYIHAARWHTRLEKVNPEVWINNPFMPYRILTAASE
jgi:hypothetical protein